MLDVRIERFLGIIKSSKSSLHTPPPSQYTVRTMGSMPVERRLNAETVAVIGAGPSGLAAAR